MPPVTFLTSGNALEADKAQVFDPVERACGEHGTAHVAVTGQHPQGAIGI